MELGVSKCFAGARQGMGWRQRPEQILCALTWTSPYDMYGIRHCPVPITDWRRFGWRKEKRKQQTRRGIRCRPRLSLDDHGGNVFVLSTYILLHLSQ